jgi:hypothetical protein
MRTRLLQTSCLSLMLLMTNIWAAEDSQNRTSKVRLYVLSNFGIAIPSTFDVEVRDVTGAMIERAARKKSGDAIDLPYGVFFVEVVAQGFEPFVTRVIVDRPEIWVPAGLLVGTLGGRNNPCTVSGTVSRSDSAPAWLKLVALYSDFVANSVADKEGRFVLSGIRPGKYLLLTFLEGELHDSRPIEVRGAEEITIP